MHLVKLYESRFNNKKNERNAIWKVLCRNFFQQFISENSIVLDVAAGQCEFINNIKCSKKIAIDLNPKLKEYADANVEVFNISCLEIEKFLCGKRVDRIFISNFLEHLNTKEEIVELFTQCYKIGEDNLKILVLQPNIKYTKGNYWDFIDHKLPITDKSVIEAAEAAGFKPVKNIKKFLPYTTKSKLPQFPLLVKLYLKLMPISGFVMGKQSFIILEK